MLTRMRVIENRTMRDYLTHMRVESTRIFLFSITRIRVESTRTASHKSYRAAIDTQLLTVYVNLFRLEAKDNNFRSFLRL
jgi:hypothetical protein